MLILPAAFTYPHRIRILPKALAELFYCSERQTSSSLWSFSFFEVCVFSTMYMYVLQSYGRRTAYSEEILCFVMMQPWFIVMMIHLCLMYDLVS